MTRRSVPHRLAPTVPALVPTVSRIAVERRGLERYQQLVESLVNEVA
jgi:hypothetical protein